MFIPDRFFLLCGGGVKICMCVLSFYADNEMDGESLVTLIGSKPGPDSLKDLVQKVGLRMKLYKAIKELYDGEAVSKLIQVYIIYFHFDCVAI